VNQAYKKHQDQATFRVVYIREAHPEDEWKTGDTSRLGLGGVINQPKTEEERLKVATGCKAKLELEPPFLMDTIDNKANSIYSAWPDRIYIINSEGKIHYKAGVGPHGFHVDEAEASLKQLLQEARSVAKK